jgi:16S rRNA (guanine527-N7)-methyltransferase
VTKDEFRDRVTARARRADAAISEAEIDALDTYFRLLARWNRTINLTALPLEPPTDEALDRLLIEPVVAAHYIREAFDSTPLSVWFDLGSGGGSPAIPLKIAIPQLRLTMVEGRARKAAFLSEAVRALNLGSAAVIAARFEDLDAPQHSADLVTVRAVRADESLDEAASMLLAVTGVFALFGPQTPQGESWEVIRTVQLLPWAEPSKLSLSRRVPRGTKRLTSI